MPEHTPAPTPARSLYGFFMYLFSKTVLAIYCIWAFLPDHYLHMLNITYYPQKYWSTAIPIQCLVGLTIFAFVIYPSSNMILTASIDSIYTIVDNFSLRKLEKKVHISEPTSCICRDAAKCALVCYDNVMRSECGESTVPMLYDLDIRHVSKKLYFNKVT